MSMKTSPVSMNSVVQDPSMLTKLIWISRLERIFISQKRAVRCLLSKGSFAVLMAISVFESGCTRPMACPKRLVMNMVIADIIGYN